MAQVTLAEWCSGPDKPDTALGLAPARIETTTTPCINMIEPNYVPQSSYFKAGASACKVYVSEQRRQLMAARAAEFKGPVTPRPCLKFPFARQSSP
jgi:hypothetical protein